MKHPSSNKSCGFVYDLMNYPIVIEFVSLNIVEGVAQWGNPLTWKPEQSGGMVSRHGRASPLEHHDKGLRTRLVRSYFCDFSAWH